MKKTNDKKQKTPQNKRQKRGQRSPLKQKQHLQNVGHQSQFQQQQMSNQIHIQQKKGQENRLQQKDGQNIQIGQQRMSQPQPGQLQVPVMSGISGGNMQRSLNSANFSLHDPSLTLFHQGNSPGHSLPGIQSTRVMGNPISGSQQMMIPGQLRQQFSQENDVSTGQGQSITANHIPRLAQNRQSAAVRNALSPMQQLVIQQQLASSQLHNLLVGLTPQQLSQILQIHPQPQPQQQQLAQPSFFHQKQSPGLPAHKFASFTASHTDVSASRNTPVPSSVQPTNANNHLIGKRKMQDLAAQLHPNITMDPEVEDILLELADNFIDSVTGFACSFAKHRKSTVLEAKDVLLHLSKNLKLQVPVSRENRSS